MKQQGIKGLVIVVVLAVGCLSFTLFKGYKPLLGLDLQGGVMVVLKPRVQADSGQIATAIEIMDQRINALGVAEPDIREESGTIVVQIAGIKDTDRAIALVGETAELRFRPVLADLAPSQPTPTESTPPGTDVPGTDVPGTTPGTEPGGTTGTTPAELTPSTPTTTAPIDSSTTTTAAPGPQAWGGGEGEVALGAQTPDTVSDSTSAPTTTTAVDPNAPTTLPADPNAPTTLPADPSASSTTAPVDPNATPSTTAAPTTLTPEQLQQLQAQAGTGETTQPGDDKADQTVILPVYERDPESGEMKEVRRVQLGPALLTGTALEDATAGLSGTDASWVVRPKFKPGADGIDKFNSAASLCFSGGAQCPTKRLAITLDGRVITDPSIKTATFQADQVQISGSFTEADAKEVATKLRYGALPIVLDRQQVNEVSATLGQDALHAGVVAGLVGFALVVLYMILFYRLLGVLAILKLGVEFALLWSIISYLGENAGLALTLAGLCGVIMSIGTSLDSNVVYYEHLKEDIRNGRTVRSAVDKSFAGAFSTIVKADGVSVLGAALLYFLSIGAVRGFALLLGLSTLLDLFTSYYFMRPVVAMAVRSDMASRKPGLFGLPRPQDIGDSTLAKAARRTRGRGAKGADPDLAAGGPASGPDLEGVTS